MNARPKKKLCWNCEGSVSVKAETCPFCGVSVVGLSEEISLGVPQAPYRLVNPSDSIVPLSPYADEEEPSDSDEALVEEEAASKEDVDQNDDSKQVVMVLGLLLLGSIFFIFGFALLLFSDEGYLTLHWDAGYWFIYLLLALFMLFFGVRRLNTLSS